MWFFGMKCCKEKLCYCEGGGGGGGEYMMNPCFSFLDLKGLSIRFKILHMNIIIIITQPSIYGVIVYFLLCHESLNDSTGQ